MQLVHQTDEVFQIVVDMFDEINHTLPRIVTFMEILGESPTLLEPSRDCMYLSCPMVGVQDASNLARHHAKVPCESSSKGALARKATC
jgi:hypothetical protein